MSNPASHPEVGIDYPRTMTGFDAWFVSETACAEFLGQSSLAGTFSMHVLLRNRRLADGAGSVAMQPVSASNIGDGGDDLRWHLESHCAFGSIAMWYVTNQNHGVSALGLQRIHGLGSYQTDWASLHKLRRAMVRPGRDLLDKRGSRTKPMWAAGKPASWGDRRRPSRSSRLRRKSEGGALAGSE